MNSIKMLLLAVAITFSSALSASTAPKTADTKAISTDVAKLLKGPKFLLEDEVVVNVTLTVNKNNEFVVLSVDSKDASIVSFIKSRLNYNEASIDVNEKNMDYVVPVRLRLEE